MTMQSEHASEKSLLEERVADLRKQVQGTSETNRQLDGENNLLKVVAALITAALITTALMTAAALIVPAALMATAAALTAAPAGSID